MDRLDIQRTHLALLLSLIGVGLPLQAGATSSIDREQTRSIVGLDLRLAGELQVAPQVSAMPHVVEPSVATDADSTTTAAIASLDPSDDERPASIDSVGLLESPWHPADTMPPDARSSRWSRSGPPEPRRPSDRDPAPASKDTPDASRRNSRVVAASLLLPPEDVETLDETLRIRLRGQFRLLERVDVETAEADDPLLALLQVISDRDAARPALPSILFVAQAPEDPRAAAVSADVFRHVAEGIELWASTGEPMPIASTTLVASTTDAPESPDIAPTSVAALVENTTTIAAAPTSPAVPWSVARLEPLPSPVAARRASQEPLLPRNPFAWYGDDAIDLSVSLVGHPLLVGTQRVASSRAPAPHPLMPLTKPVATVASRPTMVEFVDIFDPKLAARRATEPPPRPLPPIARMASLPPLEGAATPAPTRLPDERDTIVAAMDRQVRSATVAAVSQKAREEVREIRPVANTPSPPAPVFEADEARMSPLQGMRVAVADARLDDLRGGFETDGLKVSFGIERAVYINGNLVTSTSLNVADLNRLTAGQAQAMGLDRSTLGIIQSGPNNTFSPGQIGASSVATVIQNTLNDQRIQGITQINATVNSLDLVRRTGIQQNIQNALVDSIRH